ncbi:hypothetical protein [Klebsiella phage Kpn13]|uniref:Uncharacterized protein n=1 Tax=Klebsiella phage Kpn13 TaxID=3044024 RepID=A0AAT9V688_9CAUD|nr:hypothetical protein [Klebsiella phage Kpn13]
MNPNLSSVLLLSHLVTVQHPVVACHVEVS